MMNKLKEFFKELKGNRVEGEILKSFLYSVITSAVIIGILYYMKFRFIEGFMADKGFFMIMAGLSYALMIPTVRQVRAYREMGCMAGMMVGMTVGMTAGFLAGMYVGGTNGMFTGSLWGMILGIGMGIYNGKCCGIMGMMEGTMAGLMGGLMGGMTAVMLLNDHLKAMSIIIYLIAGMIIFGLNYMIYKEMRELHREKNNDQFSTILITIILISITTWIIIYGPRSPLFS